MTSPVPFVFRQIDVGSSVRFGFATLVGGFHLWLVIGAAMALVSSALGGMFWGARPPFFGCMILFLALGLWPLAVATRVSLARLNNRSVGLAALADVSGVLSILLPVALIFTVAGAGGLAFDWALTRIFSKEMPSVAAGLNEPLSLMGIMRFYPLVCLGGITVALPLSFSPWVAVDKGLGVSDAMAWAGRLSKDVKMEMMFLMGMMFFTVSVSFLLGTLVRGKGFPDNVASHVIFACAFAFAAGVWTEAYRQVLTYEAPESVKKTSARVVYKLG